MFSLFKNSNLCIWVVKSEFAKEKPHETSFLLPA